MRKGRRIKKPKFVNYHDFKKEIFDTFKNDNKVLHTFFYYSLFDPSGWEERIKFLDFKKLQKEIKENVLVRIRKQNTKFYKTYIARFGKTKDEREEKFIKRFVYSDRLCRFLMASWLKDNKFRVILGYLSKKEKPPDIVIKRKRDGKAIVIETKRFVSCSNLKERIEAEIIGKKFKHDNILVIFFFPEIEGDNRERVYSLIKGYYIYEDYLKSKMKKNVKMYIFYVSKKYLEDSEYVFHQRILLQ